MANIKTQLYQFKETFDPLLLNFLKKQESEAKKISPKTAILVKEIKRTVQAGGKRLRPALLFHAFRACGGKKDKECLKQSMALEIFHTCWLIHDDILDRGDKRRGRNSVFKKQGQDTALLVGDLGLILAHSLINQREVFKLFNLLNKEVILGQYLDVSSSGKKNKDFNENFIFKIMEYKTARYTFVRPLQIGATLAGASPELLKSFWQYGQNLGLAFQIQDDILGVFGQEKKLGKSVLSDLQEGKQTLLVLETLKGLAGNRKKSFLKIWGNKKANRKDLTWLKNLMKSSGALERVKKQTRNYALKAKENLVKLRIRKKEKSFFSDLADFVIKREF